MLAMTATLIAGSELTLIGATRSGARRFRAIIADILLDRIVLEASDAGVDGADGALPASGSAATFLHDGRMFDCAVVRGSGTQLTISRPHDLESDDRRSSRRIATSLPASVRRPNLLGDVQAAHVVDLSLGGAKLLTEAIDDGISLVVGAEIDIRMGAIATRAWVRHVQPHRNPRLRLVGIEFAPMNDLNRRHLLETVGSLRAGMHRWR